MPPRSRAHHASRSRVPFALVVAGLVVVLAGLLVWRLDVFDPDGVPGAAASQGKEPTPTGSPVPSASPSAAPSATPSPPPTPGPINTAFAGMTTFRGNATRSWYGAGPVPEDPRIAWRYPETGSLCSESSDQHGVRLWCGTGWTGQPNVIVGDDGGIEVRINAYDGAYHFVDGLTGEPVRPELQTGDLAKGSASSDPDGYPLYYAGSR
ncbi:MAG: hypothetical protein WD834_06295, partial [Actinomycetota bacterium]